MNQDTINYVDLFVNVFKFTATYIVPIAAFIVSCIALVRSNATMKVQVQVSEVEEKLRECELSIKKYELDKIQAEKNIEYKANIEARVNRIANNKYRLKVWNSGNATAHNVNVSIPNEYKIIIIKDKMPYEYLEPNNSFEEVVVMHTGSSSKFIIISTWEDESGKQFKNEKLSSC